MTLIENNFEDHFQQQQGEGDQQLNGGEEEYALTLRALVSTKEAGVIIGKGNIDI
jgi:hypothetical protein